VRGEDQTPRRWPVPIFKSNRLKYSSQVEFKSKSNSATDGDYVSKRGVPRGSMGAAERGPVAEPW